MPESAVCHVYIPLTTEAFSAVKAALRQYHGDAKSSHLSEALAAAAGFRTNAALLAAVNAKASRYVRLDPIRFVERLGELNGIDQPDPEDAILFDILPYPKEAPVIRTWSHAFDTTEYTSARERAWRNLMVAAINAGMERGLFGPCPGENWWPGYDPDPRKTEGGHVFPFQLDGLPAAGFVGDAGWDELSVHVALFPSEDISRVRVANAGFWAGEAFATGWMERRSASYLQSSDVSRRNLQIRKKLLERVANLEVQPLCFADRGSFRL